MLIEKIKKLYIFEGFNDKFLNDVINNSHTKKFSKGDYIIKEKDKSDNAYIIISGIVSVLKNNKQINTIFEGDIFGEISLVTNEPRTASIVSETDLEVLVFNKEILLKIISYYPNGEIIKKTILNRIIQNNSLNNE